MPIGPIGAVGSVTAAALGQLGPNVGIGRDVQGRVAGEEVGRGNVHLNNFHRPVQFGISIIQRLS